MNNISYYFEKKAVFKEKIILCCVLYSAMFVLSLVWGYFVYLCFGLGLLSLILLKNKEGFGFLLYIFPTAPVLRMQIGKTSLFTILEIFFLFVIVFRRRKVDSKLILFLFLFFLELILPLPDLKEIVKLFDIVLIYYFFIEEYSPNLFSYYKTAFIGGMLFSTIIGFVKTKIPRMLSFFPKLETETILGDVKTRFSGLFDDPNYFSVPIILCIYLCLISLFYEKNNKLLWTLVFSFFSICGFLTISKSFFLLYCFVLLFFVLFGENKSVKSRVFFCFLICVVFLIMGLNSLFDSVIYRFTESLNKGDVTTGRMTIWKMYIERIISSFKIMLIGDGIGGSYLNGRASHNTYIEIVYQIGLLGGGLYITILWYCTTIMKKIATSRRSIMNIVGYLIISVAFCFLNGLTAYEFPFYLMVCYMIYTYDFNAWLSKTDKMQ